MGTSVFTSSLKAINASSLAGFGFRAKGLGRRCSVATICFRSTQKKNNKSRDAAGIATLSVCACHVLVANRGESSLAVSQGGLWVYLMHYTPAHHTRTCAKDPQRPRGNETCAALCVCLSIYLWVSLSLSVCPLLIGCVGRDCFGVPHVPPESTQRFREETTRCEAKEAYIQDPPTYRHFDDP